MLIQTFVYWPIFSTAANGGMFFSSHVTGQSHNPARGRRLAQKFLHFIILGKNLPQYQSTKKRNCFKKLSIHFSNNKTIKTVFSYYII